MTERPLDAEDRVIAGFGYKPQFKRVLGLFADFSLGYSYMSPLAGFYALFAFALTVAGPAYFWTMPVILFGQVLVAMVFAEASSQYPIAGGVYQWARRLVGPRWGFLTAFMYLLALLATNAGLAYGGAPYLAALFGYEVSPFTNAIGALAMIIIAAAINFGGTKLLAKGVEAGVWAGLIGLGFAGIYLLLFGQVQPWSVLFQNFGAGSDNYVAALFAASLIGIWIIFGFEACGDLGEEVQEASHKIPRAMMLTMLVGGVSTLVIGLGMTLAVPDMQGAVSGTVANPAEAVLLANFGPIGAKLGIIMLVIIIVSAAAAIMASTSRLLFSMARDRLVFGHNMLAKIDEKRGLPNAAIMAATVVPCIIILLGMFSSNAITQLISFATAGIYTSFHMVVGGALYARLKGWKPAGSFKLGSWGLLLNALALAFGIVMILNLMWPRTPDVPWYLNYIIPLSVLFIFVLGLLQLGNVTRQSNAR
ncbi:amino acid permease [Hypericibacter terrae]|uniref:Amino acid permease n=1 Tax=Hypericibacter terrae TaxID=2602015 RepID=A0A5J6MVI8_9PROT|nr:APC family permease [Hypericibacter terrae]QEX18786.1 amino acid permease [Hypericibacter terrae]